MLKHASIESIVVGHHWISSCKIHIYWKGKGLSFYYCSNCQYCSKIKCTTTLKRDAIFGISHGSVRNWPSQKSINPFLRACVHCAQWTGPDKLTFTMTVSRALPWVPHYRGPLLDNYQTPFLPLVAQCQAPAGMWSHDTIITRVRVYQFKWLVLNVETALCHFRTSHCSNAGDSIPILPQDVLY